MGRKPEKPAIIVGTQDLLVSRALNRGYAMSRYAWSIHYGLLNNDAFWVFDETQLMGVAVETSAQLQGLRQALGTLLPTRSLWMSATLAEQQLNTVDHPQPADGWQTHRLSAADRDRAEVHERTHSTKHLHQIDLQLEKDSDKKEAKKVAAHVQDVHVDGTLTLVVCNRVDRARLVYEALLKNGRTSADTSLVHSRFRPADRADAQALLFGADPPDDRIVVTTQALEAGVDVSARTLVTELAPWSSLVQRLGRCNRYGEFDSADVHWIDIDEEKSRGKVALPYDPEQLATARELLLALEECGPAVLAAVDPPDEEVIRPVLRRRDLLQLFDTSADISGDDVDISRFVRDDQDLDVQLFWRELPDGPNDETPRPRREELCRVSIGAATDFLKKTVKAGRKKRKRAQNPGLCWTWDGVDRQWVECDPAQLIPGDIVLVDSTAGGYDPELGWTAEKKNSPVPPIPCADDELQENHTADSSTKVLPEEAVADDQDAWRWGTWIPLTNHLTHVGAVTRQLAESLELDRRWADALATAADWHDVGKAHPEFQRRLLEPVEDTPDALPPDWQPDDARLWAKSSHSFRLKGARRYFRHELASTLCWLTHGSLGLLEQEHGDAVDVHSLTAFLIACHHGKVRMRIRSLPEEEGPQAGAFALGVYDGDLIPPVTLPDGTVVPETTVELGALMGLGTGCWLERTLALRDHPDLGPLRLAGLEALLRVADHRASADESRNGGTS